MNYAFHPEAAEEYAESVVFYKSINAKLAIRFNEAVTETVAKICSCPTCYRINATRYS